jgi:hypothetical protein
MGSLDSYPVRQAIAISRTQQEIIKRYIRTVPTALIDRKRKKNLNRLIYLREMIKREAKAKGKRAYMA